MRDPRDTVTLTRPSAAATRPRPGRAEIVYQISDRRLIDAFIGQP